MKKGSVYRTHKSKWKENTYKPHALFFRKCKIKKKSVHIYQQEANANFKNTFCIRDILQVLWIVIILIAWLWMRGLKNDSENHPISNTITMEHFLEVAMKPLGNTMYIWGGGWDADDEKSGGGSTLIGVSPIWTEFATKQDASYNYEEYRFERELGLDCSGYVGWVIYNVFETENGNEGYVTFSTDMAENFASRGWGKLYKNPKQFLTGDIVSMDGHVWICLGTCADGSVLLIHSSPPGVSICGTELSHEEKNLNSVQQDTEDKTKTISIATQLAQEFMETYYEKWQSLYPNRTVSQTYLQNVTVMRWNTDTFLDAENYQELSGEKVIQILKMLQNK